jgi:flagellar FliJ protein
MAKKFNFKLEPVLKYRNNLEKEELRKFAEAQGKVVEKQNYIDNLQQDKQVQQQEIVEMFQSKKDIQNIVEVYRFINTVDLRTAYADKELKAREKDMEIQRASYLASRKKRRAIELLKEKRLEEYKKNESLEENKTLDNLAVMRKVFSQEDEEDK